MTRIGTTGTAIDGATEEDGQLAMRKTMNGPRAGRLLNRIALACASVLSVVYAESSSLDASREQADRGRIVFVSNRGGNNDIYVMWPDGSGVVNLTNHPASDRLPSWSPDGSRIAFRSTRDRNAEIYVMNDDGSNVVRVTFHPAVDTSPSWTPDGRVLFSSNRSGRY
jgi:Tol biopolymer transport system component